MPLLLMLPLIGQKTDARFLNQSCTKRRNRNRVPGFGSHLKTALYSNDEESQVRGGRLVSYL